MSPLSFLHWHNILGCLLKFRIQISDQDQEMTNGQKRFSFLTFNKSDHLGRYASIGSFLQRCCCAQMHIAGTREHWSSLSSWPVGQVGWSMGKPDRKITKVLFSPPKSRCRTGERGRQSEDLPSVTTLPLPRRRLARYPQCSSSLGWLCGFATRRPSCVSPHHLRRLIPHSFMSLPVHFNRLVNRRRE